MLRIYGDQVVIVGARSGHNGIVFSSCSTNTRPMRVDLSAEPPRAGSEPTWPPQGDPGDETDAE